MKDALYWEGTDNSSIAYSLCPHRCKITEGDVGGGLQSQAQCRR